MLNRLLPFVAIGTVADCQSILNAQNRLLVKSGLQILQKNQYHSKGLQNLMIASGLQEKIDSGYKLTSQDLGYVLSPILNSSGRVSHAHLSISVLANDDFEEAKELVLVNQQRKQMVKDILAEVEQMALSESGNNIIWLQGDWSKGIVGLLASRLVNQYDLPVVVVSTLDPEHSTGSLRAPEGFHLPNAMQKSQEESSVDTAVFEKFGGHPCAAGFSILPKNLPLAKKLMNKYLETPEFADKIDYCQKIVPENVAHLKYKKDIIWLNEADITPLFLSQIMQMDPFGQDFSFPFLMFRHKISDFRYLGSESKHIKFKLSNGITMTAFNISETYKMDDELYLMAKVSQNTWKNVTNLELIIDQIFKITK